MSTIYFSGQQTKYALELVSENRKSDTVLITSEPPFNIKRKITEWKETNKLAYNSAVFGFRAPVLMAEIMELVGGRKIEFSLNTYVQKYMESVLVLINVMYSTGFTLKNDKLYLAVNRLHNFITRYSALKKEDVKSVDDWLTFVRETGLPADWMNRLHVDQVLSIFGVPDYEAKFILDAPYYDTDKVCTQRNQGVRWLSKQLAGFSPNGCLTDAVNLIHYLLGKPSSKTELDLINVLEEFKDKITSGYLVFAQVPDICIIDGELDDLLSVDILEFLNKKLEKKLKVVVQFPDARDEESLRIRDLMCDYGWTVCTDVDSENIEAIRSAQN